MDSEFLVRGGMINKHREYTANEVVLGQEFSLSPGQSTMIAGENLAIKFIEVISDGRCPKGAICVWAGEASCLTEITNRSESTYCKVLTQPGLSGPSKTSFINYKITFDLQPYPEVSKAPDKKGYHLRLVISKKSFRTSLK
jgi:hypothetical protein